MNKAASEQLEARLGVVISDFIERDGLHGKEIAQCIVCALSALLVRAWLAALTPNVTNEERPREVAKSIRGGPWEQVAELTMLEAKLRKERQPKADA